MRKTSARLKALLATWQEKRKRPRPKSSRPTTPPWPVGTVLRERDADGSTCALRLVVGSTFDGDCLTIYLTPPPWLTPEQARQVLRGTRGLAALTGAA